MTLVFMVLAVAACIGWTLHARTLHGTLHKAWAEIDALENHEQPREKSSTADFTRHDTADPVGVTINKYP
jgi:hypothetical protein